jgi:hypothetical protein
LPIEGGQAGTIELDAAGVPGRAKVSVALFEGEIARDPIDRRDRPQALQRPPEIGVYCSISIVQAKHVFGRIGAVALSETKPDRLRRQSPFGQPTHDRVRSL